MSTVTVLVTTIPGREKLLARALESVDKQTRQPDAVVVELDEHRTSAAEARNRALKKVDTEYVAILDDDDQFLPNHLQVLMDAVAENPDADLVYPAPDIRNMKDGTGVIVNGRWHRPWGLEFSEDHRLHLIHKGNFIPVTVLLKTASLRRVGGFPPPGAYDRRLSDCEDWLCFRRMALKGMTFVHVNTKTWVWQPNSLGNTGGKGLL